MCTPVKEEGEEGKGKSKQCDINRATKWFVLLTTMEYVMSEFAVFGLSRSMA